MNDLYAQFVGAAALITIVTSVQCKKKKNMMIMQTIANILYSFQYILLNALSAAIMNIIVILRCLIFYKYDKKRKKIPLILPILIIIATIILGAFIYTEPLSLIPIIITIAYTVGASFKNPRVFKIVFLACAFVWMYFNYRVSAFVCVFGNICEVISTSIALYKDKKNSVKKQK